MSKSKYHREIKDNVWVDVYDVLVAFDVDNPAIQHALKKMLAPGQRGVKDTITDIKEAIISLTRAIELEQDAQELLDKPKAGSFINCKGETTNNDYYKGAL